MNRYLTISKKIDFSNGKIKFLYVGQLIPRKGVDILIKAFKIIAKTYENIELVIVGDGPEKENLVQELDVSTKNKVKFLGYQDWDSLPNHYKPCDIFCFPSRHDGWGLPIYEAMASGMPVISTNAVGAVHDLVDDTVGKIVPVDDISGLANSMTYFITHPDAIIQMGQNARERIMNNYTLEAGIHQFVSASQEVISNTR